MGVILTVAFNFLDLEDLDADYHRSVEHAVRVASLFQATASADSLGPSFLSTGPDRFAFYIQRVRFEQGPDDIGPKARAAVAKLASACRNRLLLAGSWQAGTGDAVDSGGLADLEERVRNTLP